MSHLRHHQPLIVACLSVWLLISCVSPAEPDISVPPTDLPALSTLPPTGIPPTATVSLLPSAEPDERTVAEEQATDRLLIPEVVAVYPHQPNSFTQGLLWYDGYLYESDGEYGLSGLLKVELESGNVVQRVDLDDRYFGEGLARFENRLIQITWQEETAFIYDLETFEVITSIPYEGQGWGICYDGALFWMSNGSDRIVARDPDTFGIVQEIVVTDRGQPVPLLNELECVGEHIYANVWKTDIILQIDKQSGAVTTLIEASRLLSAEERSLLVAGRDVLNGIAYNPEEEVFYVTGKNWPKLFAVRFVTP